jgi:predicted esterase
VALLALACPVREGCAGSWWRWDGPPAWIARQVDAFAARRAIDRRRLWLAGWSGGASYIGWRTQMLEETFSSFVLMGGGIPPADAGCPATAARVYFLVGDGNPLHGLARRLRAHYDACQQEVRWHLLPGATHPQERASMATMQGAVLDWLQAGAMGGRTSAPGTEPAGR